MQKIDRNLIYRLQQNVSNIYYSDKYIEDGYIENLKKSSFYKDIKNQKDIDDLNKISQKESKFKLGVLKSLIAYNYLNQNPLEILFSGNFNINEQNQYYEDIKFKTKFLIPSFTSIKFYFNDGTLLNIPNNTSFFIMVDDILKLSKSLTSKYLKEIIVFDNIILIQELKQVHNTNSNQLPYSELLENFDPIENTNLKKISKTKYKNIQNIIYFCFIACIILHYCN